MEHTSIDECLSFAVITDPAGNMDFLRKAILDLPYREIERTKKSKKQKVENLEAIFVIGRLVDPLFRPEEARAVENAREYLQDEIDHNRDSYRRINITDVPGLAHHLRHNAPFRRWHEQEKLIPAIEKFIGLKKDNAWLNFGVVKDRIVEQYRQMEEIAEASQIPVYFAADTIFLEQVIPEERWLHWKSMLLGIPQQQLIKAVGMTGIDFAVPEYLVDPTMRGNTRFSLAGFEPLQGKITITYGMSSELLKQLRESKKKIVIAGKQGLFDKEANPAEHYPSNLLFLERPLSMSFYSFGNEVGTRVVYFLQNNRLMYFPESQINLKEMSASAGQLPLQSDAEAALQLADLAADMMRVLPILEKQNPELAQKIRKAGFDRPQQLAHILDFYANQVREKEDVVMRFASFVDEIIRHAKLSDWCQDKKREIYDRHGVPPDRPASHAVEMAVYDFLISTAKDALERRERATEQASERSLASIEELVGVLGLKEWYDEQKGLLSQKNGAAGCAPVMELYSLAITKIKEELNSRNKTLAELASVKKQNEQYTSRIEELDTIVRQRDKRLDEFIEENTKLEVTLTELTKNIKELTQQADELKARYEKQISEINAQVADRDRTIKLQTTRLDELGDTNDELNARVTCQEEAIAGLKRDKAELEKNLRDYATLKAQLAELEKLARQLKAEHPNIIAEDVKGIFDAYKTGAENALSDTKRALEQLQNTLREYERQLHTRIPPDKALEEGIRAAREELQKRYEKVNAQIIAEAQKFREDVIEKYEKAKTNFESQLAEKDKKIAGLEAALKEAASKPAAPAESSREIAKKAYLLVEQGKYAEGIDEYTSAIQTVIPLFARMLVNRGRAHFQKGNYQSALADFMMAREISPNYININQLITTAREYQSRFEASKGQEHGKEKTVTS